LPLAFDIFAAAGFAYFVLPRCPLLFYAARAFCAIAAVFISYAADRRYVEYAASAFRHAIIAMIFA